MFEQPHTLMPGAGVNSQTTQRLTPISLLGGHKLTRASQLFTVSLSCLSYNWTGIVTTIKKNHVIWLIMFVSLVLLKSALQMLFLQIRKPFCPQDRVYSIVLTPNCNTLAGLKFQSWQLFCPLLFKACFILQVFLYESELLLQLGCTVHILNHRQHNDRWWPKRLHIKIIPQP